MQGPVSRGPCGTTLRAPGPTSTNANLVITKLGTAGKICIYTNASADLIADVSGYFPAGADYKPISNPTRILDTRTDTGATGGSAGCGLVSAAFCETFAGGVSAGGREGDLDASRWSVGRTVGNTSNSDLMPFPPTPVSACRAGVATATADNDLLVCDNSSGHTGQLLTAMSAQNYGILSMRPRQPFDFAARTGTIAYNVDAITEGILAWWTSIYVTDDPTSMASDSAQVAGMLPRNGVGINFDDGCGTTDASKVRVGSIFVYKNTAETKISGANSACVTTKRGSLNHIEIRLSQTNIEVWASDYSTDGGHTFPNFKRVFTTPIDLSITRGYVHFQQAERAPVKYATQSNISPGYANNYWSNLGFDGPVISPEISYALPDALTTNPNTGAANIGYTLLNNPYATTTCCTNGQPTATILTIPNVNTAAISTAELSFAVNYTYYDTALPTTVSLRYSLNGGPWRTPNPQPNTVGQNTCTGCPGPTGGGGVLYNFPIPISDLQTGTNTIALAIDNSINSWAPILTSLDLITHH